MLSYAYYTMWIVMHYLQPGDEFHNNNVNEIYELVVLVTMMCWCLLSLVMLWLSCDLLSTVDLPMFRDLVFHPLSFLHCV